MGRILYLVAVVLVIIWAIIFLGGFVIGNLIHILLVVAVIMVIINLFGGGTRKP